MVKTISMVCAVPKESYTVTSRVNVPAAAVLESKLAFNVTDVVGSAFPPKYEMFTASKVDKSEVDVGRAPLVNCQPYNT